MFDYEINNETLAIIPIGETRTKIVECRRNFIVDKNSMEILNVVDNYCFSHANALTYNKKENKCS